MFILSVPVIPFVIMGVLAVGIITVGVIAARKAINEVNDIRQNGICVDSVVCSCEEYRHDHKTRYRTKVRFIGPNGTTEERELDYVGGMPIGRKVRIQYIPGKYDRVVFISQQIGSENEAGVKKNTSSSNTRKMPFSVQINGKTEDKR